MNFCGRSPHHARSTYYALDLDSKTNLVIASYLKYRKYTVFIYIVAPRELSLR